MGVGEHSVFKTGERAAVVPDRSFEARRDARLNPLSFAEKYHMRFLLLLTALAAASVSRTALACPACGPVLQPTWSERIANCDAAVLVQLVSAKRGSADGKTAAATVFEVVQVAKDTDKLTKKGARITIPKFVESEAGNLFLLWGKKKGKSIAWNPAKEVSETAYHYITQAPPNEVPGPKRLRFFLKFFEFPDELIATDAYIEFAKAPYKDVKAISDAMDRKKVRKWLSDPNTVQSRIGLYGLMLGLCGTREDIPFLEKQIVTLKKEFRLGVDGVIAGYLMLVGEKGMDLIDRTKLVDEAAPESETFSAIKAIRIIWTYGDGTIGKDRLRRSMRLLIDRPKYVETVIPDLARWRDWSLQDRLMSLYDHKEYKAPSTRRAIIRYLLASVEDTPKDAKTPPPHVTKGRAMLERLKKKDPKNYRIASRTFY